MAAGYVEALKRHSREIQQLEGRQAEEFLRLLRALKEQVAGRLDAIGTEPLDAFRLRTVLGETEAGIKVLESKAQQQYGKATADAVDMAIDHIGDELERLSKAFDARPLDVTIDAAAALADPGQMLLANHFGSSVTRYGLDALNQVRQRVFVGLRTGDTVGSVVRDLSGAGGPFGEAGKAAGQRLVRTEVSQAYNSAGHHGIVQASKQVKGLLKTWVHVGSYSCDVCGPLHGTTRPVDGTWTVRIGKRTREILHPPVHPNDTCRCVTMKQSWKTGMEKLGYLQKQEEGERPTL